MRTEVADHLNLKTHSRGYCVSTVKLSVEHEWGPEGKGGYWYETYVFPSNGHKITDWLELWGTRYRTEAEARDGHARVAAAIERGEDPDADDFLAEPAS